MGTIVGKHSGSCGPPPRGLRQGLKEQDRGAGLLCTPRGQSTDRKEWEICFLDKMDKP